MEARAINQKNMFIKARERLVAELKASGYIKSKSVEEAFLSIPREMFIQEHLRDSAYVDSPLPIGHMQTISAPSMIAIMLEALDLTPGQKVLEIGAGSGYHAALVAHIVGKKGRVYTIERIPELAEFAKSNLKKIGFDKRVTVVVGDGSLGYKSASPYHRIYLTCAAPTVPEYLLSQLMDHGILLAPVGRSRWWQDLIRVMKMGDNISKENLGGCVFVPLIGKYGFRG